MVSHPIHAGGGGYLNADLFLFHPLVLSAVATIGASIIVQLVSPSDPWGKTLLFLKQLGRQVSSDGREGTGDRGGHRHES